MLTTPRSEESIFAEALELTSPAARAAFLDVACGQDAQLRGRVERLLKSNSGAGSFLQKPVAVTTDRPLTERPGSMIGPYKLREQIGEGGFGVVYVAEQETPVRRKVALKIIKPGMDTKDVIARFEAERQALALMDHPNVARVLDAGATDSGRPYFVMELVQGVTITDFCDKNSLPTRERLALFADVCRAVQHAHQKGIIHRDLKPSNIMVTLHDGKPVAKVIDFGVSKALSQQLTEKSIYTAYGQMIGTPSYMSPEQAEMSGLGIDTRSDIYSLGVLLYELLTGQTPLDARRLRNSAYAEILRIIREEEPPRPSLKVSTLGEQATVIAQQRHTDPKQLRRDLAGELDWIVMKCLEKDRVRRYETANGLARDIERYLADEPVEACPPSTAYRLAKYWRKHRGAISTAAAFAGLLLLCAAVSSWQAVRATLAERQAQKALLSEQRARAEAVEAKEAAVALKEEAVAAKERAEGFSQRLRDATQIANDGVDFYYRGNWAAAHDAFARAEKIERDVRGIYQGRAVLYTTLGLWDRAAAAYDRRYELAKVSSAQTLYEHALLRFTAGDDAGYRRLCEEITKPGNDGAMAIRSCALSPEPPVDPAILVRRGESLLTSLYSNWHIHLAGRAYLRAGKYDQAASLLRNGMDRERNTPGGVHRIGFAILAIAECRLGNRAEAEASLAKAEAAIDEWTRHMVRGGIGSLPIDWWDWLEALHYYREAKTLLTDTPPAEDPRVAMLRERALATITYGDALTFMAAGRDNVERKAWDQAAASFVKVLDQLPAGFRASSQEMQFCVEMTEEPEVFTRLAALLPNDPRIWSARGRRLAGARKWSEACEDLVQALALRLKDAPEPDGRLGNGPQVGRASIMQHLAALQRLAGDEGGYHRLCATIVAMADEFDDVHAAEVLSRACSLGANSVDDLTIPIRLAERAVAGSPNMAWHHFALGAAQYRAGKHRDAIASLEESLRVHPAWYGRGQNYVVLAMAHHQLGQQDDAREWLAKAETSLAEMEQAYRKGKWGFAASDYMSDWLTLLVLLPEAQKLIAAEVTPQ